jgi:hypothetical protein
MVAPEYIVFVVGLFGLEALLLAYIYICHRPWSIDILVYCHQAEPIRPFHYTYIQGLGLEVLA